MSTAPVIEHDPAQGRFFTRVDGLTCEATYTMVDGAMWMMHTGVPGALEGRGIAAALVRAALDHARAAGLRVHPVCSYVRTYMKRHPATQDLLA